MCSQVANWKIEREVGEVELFTNGKKEKACRCPQEKQRKTTIQLYHTCANHKIVRWDWKTRSGKHLEAMLYIYIYIYIDYIYIYIYIYSMMVTSSLWCDDWIYIDLRGGLYFLI